jgi:hypothetical protein
VSAPVALTGFAIGYAIDDANGHVYQKLKLTPRLLAKLLTESYPAVQAVQDGWQNTPNADEPTDYKPLVNNPINIAADPEFQALNPGISHDVGQTFGASALVMLSSDSDLVSALTSYINADPDARAWLDGQPDPWGMVVNPNYRGIKLPVDGWPLLDTFEPKSIYENGTNPCLTLNPVPYLPLVASPMNSIALISLNLQYAIQQSQVVCTNADTLNPKLVATGPETIGSRFLIGITSLADANRYRIDSAALQTRNTNGASVKSTGASGRTFVGPTDSGLRAAARLLAPNADDGTWELPYEKLVGTTGSESAYPGAMMVSAAVATKGLLSTEAHDLAKYVSYAAGAGQTPGGSSGQLPAGYLPLTSANALGAQANYAKIAAQYIAAQDGKVPSVLAPKPPPATAPSGGASTPNPTPTSGATLPAGNGNSGGAGAPPPALGNATTPAVGGGSSTPPAPSVNTSPAASASPAAKTVRLTGAQAPSAGAIGWILPILALIGLGAALAAPLLTRFAGRRS